MAGLLSHNLQSASVKFPFSLFQYVGGTWVNLQSSGGLQQPDCMAIGKHQAPGMLDPEENGRSEQIYIEISPLLYLNARQALPGELISSSCVNMTTFKVAANVGSNKAALDLSPILFIIHSLSQPG